MRDELRAWEAAHPGDPDPGVHRATLAGLRDPSLWWVSPDMTALAAAAAADLPDWTPGICRPEPTGLLLWAGDAGDAPGDDLAPVPGPLGQVPHPPVPLRGVMWQAHGDRIRVLALTDRAAVRGADPAAGATLITAAVDWPADRPVSRVLLPTTMRDLAGLVGATWILMQQTTIAEARPVPARTGAGAAAGDPPAARDVQVIDLRRLARPDHDDPDSTGAAREYHHRWLVRGHWRQQPCGPGRAARRPVYVAPHIKGPPDAPLLDERVHVWRR